MNATNTFGSANYPLPFIVKILFSEHHLMCGGSGPPSPSPTAAVVTLLLLDSRLGCGRRRLLLRNHIGPVLAASGRIVHGKAPSTMRAQ